MASTRASLAGADEHLAESVGLRTEAPAVRLAPAPLQRDAGRQPALHLGRIEVDRVVPDPDQPRSVFDKESLERLAESLRTSGQLAPIRVRWSDQHSKWLIVAGERRWRAAKQAGIATLECVFHETPLDAAQTLELQMVENLLRDDLTPIEEAQGYRQLMTLRGYTGQQVARALSVPASKVSRALALLKLPDDVQRRVDAGELAGRTAYELSKLADPDRVRRLADQAAAERLTHDDIARRVRQQRGRRGARPGGVRIALPIENGWRVIVTRRGTASYEEVEHALVLALDEVRSRITGGVKLF